jgi:transcription elongation factor Elf1
MPLTHFYLRRTGKHGNCHTPDNRIVRRVSEEVWVQLKCVFPNAIPVEVKKGDSNSNVHCELCEKEETEEEVLIEKLRDWSLVTTSSLPEIARRKRRVDELQFKLLEMDTDDESSSDNVDEPVDTLYLVHCEDMDSWRSALKMAKAYTCKNSSAMAKNVIELLFSHRNEDVNECQIERPTGKLNGSTNVLCYKGWRPRPLICSDHRLPLQRAVFDVALEPKDSQKILSRLSSFVEALFHHEYVAFLGSIFDLGVILFPGETGGWQTELIGDGNESSSPRSPEALFQSLTRTHHPQLRSPLSELGSGTPADHTQLISAHIVDGVCQEASCNNAFAIGNAQTTPQEKPGQGSTNVVDLIDENIGDLIGATEDVASIESLFSIRVFELDAVAVDENVVSSILGLPKSGSTTAVSEMSLVRRSSRKRKSAYPSDHILREDSLRVGAHHNIAAVRLFLYEASGQAFRVDENLTMIIPTTLFENGGHPNNHVDMTEEDETVASCRPPYISFELPFDLNDKSLEEVVAIASRNENSTTCLLSETFLFRRNQPNDKKGPENSNETMLDSLFEISNASSSAVFQASDTRARENKSRRRTERGFTGTLLHSSSPKVSESTCLDSPDLANIEEAPNSSNAEHSNNADEQRTDGCVELAVEGDPPWDGEIHEIGTSAEKVSHGNFVVIDESVDEKMSTRTGSEKQPKRPLARPVTRALDETLSVLVSHSGSAPPLQNAIRAERLAMESDARRLLRSTIIDPKEEALVSKLIEAVSQFDESCNSNVLLAKCRDAAKWALVANSSEASIPELIDSAFAKYLQRSFSRHHGAGRD